MSVESGGVPEKAQTSPIRRAKAGLENTVKYIRVAPQWHAPAVALGIAGTSTGYEAVKEITSGNIASLMVSCQQAIFCQLDTTTPHPLFQDEKTADM